MRSLVVALALIGGIAQPSAQVPRADCFPIERIPAALRARAETLLLEAMDGTALYTVAGGLKPMTSNFLPSLGRFGTLRFAKADMKADSPAAQQVDELRQTIAVLRCGEDIQSAVVTEIDMNAGEGYSSAEPWVFHMPAIRRVIAEHAAFFGPIAITPHTSPETMLFTMQRQQAAERARVNGALYGYARYAVDAFVETGEKIRRGERPPDSSATPVASLMMRIPTYGGESVWYRKPAPEDAPEDRALRAKALEILEDYKKRRAKFVGEGKPGIVALLRDWFCTGESGCRAPTLPVPAR